MSGMFAIGTFSQIAGVSVRTLRHYDDVGLLRPAHVDALTGYRYYEAPQVTKLNRILVLKELGFTLTEITRMIEAGVSSEQLVGMLRLRQADAQRAHDAEQLRLTRVAARIKLIEGDHPMSAITSIVVKPLPAAHLATISEPASGFDADFGPIFGRLYPALYGELARLGVPSVGPQTAMYRERADGQIDVVACAPIAPEASIESPTITAVHLPSVPRAATLIHHGPMADISKSYDALMAWMTEAGETPIGYSRELYLDCAGEQQTWVTELQFELG
jgi:DNA-binding transcriptional MerR regulator/effector-binding domain-containing protein